MRKLDQETRQQTIQLYEQGIPASQIAQELGHNRDTLLQILKEEGIEIRRGRKPKKLLSFEEDLVKEFYAEGLTGREIAKRLGCGPTLVYKILRDQGIATREPGSPQTKRFGSGKERGPKSHLWKGGRHATSQGYVIVWTPEEYDYATMRSRDGYILEHRKVMAESLGRPLTSEEQVHHINGDKTDNRLVNLQLIQGRHHRSGIAQCCGDCGSTNIVPVELEAAVG